MKIEEARQLYNAQIKEYQRQQLILSAKKQELEKKMNAAQDDKKVYENEAATLELTLNAVREKQDEYGNYMNTLMEQWSAVAGANSAQQQGEAVKDYVEDLGKIMEVARRLMKGGRVPAQDEKRLMEYSMELYQSAKNIGAMVQNRKKEEYDSLWEDEEENKEYEDPIETADNTEAFAQGPEIVDVSEMLQ